MILSYVVQNTSNNNDLLDTDEAWKWTVNCEDEFEAYQQIERVKLMADMHGHKIINVYLDDEKFDPRHFYTDGANEEPFEYNQHIAISKHLDETKR